MLEYDVQLMIWISVRLQADAGVSIPYDSIKVSISTAGHQQNDLYEHVYSPH